MVLTIPVTLPPWCPGLKFLNPSPFFGGQNAEALQKFLHLEIFWGSGTRTARPGRPSTFSKMRKILIKNGRKWQKSTKNRAFFTVKTAKNRRKIQPKPPKLAKKIRFQTFLKGGARRAGAILKGRAAGSSGPPICQGGGAVAAVIGAALPSLKVAAGRWQGCGGCWLSILYGVGGHRWRWAAVYPI